MIYNKSIGLRAVEQTDLPQLLAWRNSDKMRRYFRECRELNYYNQETWFKNVCCGNDKYAMFSICASSNSNGRSSAAPDQLLGVCGLTTINWRLRAAEISLYIGLDNCYIDDLFAPDAFEALLAYAFNSANLYKIWVEVFEYDHPKTALLKKFNLHFDGKLRANHFEDGVYHDSLVFSMLKHEFVPRQ